MISRLDAIAGDAELQEKSHADLNRLGKRLWEKCEAEMQGYDEKLQQEMTTEGEKLNPELVLKVTVYKKRMYYNIDIDFPFQSAKGSSEVQPFLSCPPFP